MVSPDDLPVGQEKPVQRDEEHRANRLTQPKGKQSARPLGGQKSGFLASCAAAPPMSQHRFRPPALAQSAFLPTQTLQRVYEWERITRNKPDEA